MFGEFWVRPVSRYYPPARPCFEHFRRPTLVNRPYQANLAQGKDRRARYSNKMCNELISCDC